MLWGRQGLLGSKAACSVCAFHAACGAESC
jgi:hypothetical protein